MKNPENLKHMTKEAVKPKNIFKTLSLLFVLMIFGLSALIFFHRQAKLHQEQIELDEKLKSDVPKLVDEVIGSDLRYAYSNPIRIDLNDSAILIRNNPRDGYWGVGLCLGGER